VIKVLSFSDYVAQRCCFSDVAALNHSGLSLKIAKTLKCIVAADEGIVLSRAIGLHAPRSE
jgi:hypothetical protein